MTLPPPLSAQEKSQLLERQIAALDHMARMRDCEARLDPALNGGQFWNFDTAAIRAGLRALRALSVVSAVPRDEKDHGAGLIHQTIPDMAGTEPRPICGALVGQYGAGWTCSLESGHAGDHAPVSVRCEYCHSRVAYRDPYHVHGHNECLCGVRPAHNRYLHEKVGSATDSSTAKLADERAGALAQEHHSRTPETK